MNDLLENIDKLHITPMGIERIKRNLQLETDDVVQWCRVRILDKNAKIEKMGKNWYINVNGCCITVNSYSYTIITAHKIKTSSVQLLNPKDCIPKIDLRDKTT